jgi:hypothetical protein
MSHAAASTGATASKKSTAVLTSSSASFRLSPDNQIRLNRLRLHVDLVGVTLVRIFLPLVHVPLCATILGIYNIAGWITILTVDSTRLPEFSTTRIKQRQSWRYALKRSPILIIALGIIAWLCGLPIFPNALTVGGVAGLILSSYMDELLFRNILQAKLRQWGLSKSLAILLQTALYAASFAVQHVPVGMVASACVLGLSNGWMVYKYRSIWAAFVLSLGWHILFLGGNAEG